MPLGSGRCVPRWNCHLWETLAYTKDSINTNSLLRWSFLRSNSKDRWENNLGREGRVFYSEFLWPSLGTLRIIPDWCSRGECFPLTSRNFFPEGTQVSWADSEPLPVAKLTLGYVLHTKRGGDHPTSCSWKTNPSQNQRPAVCSCVCVRVRVDTDRDI